jgi:hypothetical protein
MAIITDIMTASPPLSPSAARDVSKKRKNVDAGDGDISDEKRL